MKILRSFISAVSILLLSLIFTILLIEVSVRIFTEDTSVITQLTYKRNCVGKKKLETNEIKYNYHMFTPGESNVHKTKEFEYIFSISSQGLRNSEIDLTKPENEYRILMLGPSWVFGWGVNQEHSIPALLEKSLNEHFETTQIKVINAGIPAQWILKNMLFYISKLHQYQPDLVIHANGQNFAYQIFQDYNEFFYKRKIILSVDNYFNTLYRKITCFPIARHFRTIYWLLERLRGTPSVRSSLEEELPIFTSDTFDLTNKKEFLSSNSLTNENFNQLTQLMFQSSSEVYQIIKSQIGLATSTEPKATNDSNGAYMYATATSLMKAFQDGLKSDGKEYLFYNLGHYPFLLDQEKIQEDKLAFQMSTEALQKNQINYINFYDYLFDQLNQEYGSSYVRSLFYLEDTHPNQEGYVLLEKYLFQVILDKYRDNIQQTVSN